LFRSVVACLAFRRASRRETASEAAFYQAQLDEIERDAEKLISFESAAMKHLIRRCAELHLEHIATGAGAEQPYHRIMLAECREHHTPQFFDRPFARGIHRSPFAVFRNSAALHDTLR